VTLISAKLKKIALNLDHLPVFTANQDISYIVDMANIPEIVVQLVHIQGPLKGEIQEFSCNDIAIGRLFSCQVQFPPDLAIVSRVHAHIAREGNRFKLIDQSTNGTYVNGKLVRESYLKHGDVLTFSEGGPKVSFLTRMKESGSPLTPSDPPIIPPRESPIKRSPPLHQYEPSFKSSPSSQAPEDAPISAVQAPLVIQYGPSLHSFKTLPVTIGSGPNCDLIVNDPGIEPRHLMIFFSQGGYYVRDLTGRKKVLVNDDHAEQQAQLVPQCRLSLSSQGPVFRFLGAGRLAEIEEDAVSINRPESGEHPTNKIPNLNFTPDKPNGKPTTGLKKFFKD
jgi:pSer/pThr/pTyr-binding forkhead associated (FHA) protein